MAVAAMESAAPDLTDAPTKVANAFLRQYYEVLKHQPELVHKFYKDISVVSRPFPDGSMVTVTTTQKIDELIQSLYDKSWTVEICTENSQYSFGDGMVILVTGLIGNEELKRGFSQIFYLAPQERGFYVFNDLFTYNVDEGPQDVFDSDAAAVDYLKEQESNVVNESTAVKVDVGNGKKEPQNVKGQDAAIVDREIIIEPKVSKGVKEVKSKSLKPTVTDGQLDRKLSYASILSFTSAPAAQPVPAHVSTEKEAPKLEVKARPSPAAVPSAPSSNIVEAISVAGAENNKKVSKPRSDADKRPLFSKENGHKQAEDNKAVSVWELPMSIKPFQLDKCFSRKFGPVKQGGIQIRSSQGKNGPLCYAFLEFESASSADAAVKASPVSMDGRPVIVKRKTNKGKNDGRARNGSPDNLSVDNTSSNGTYGKPSNKHNNGRNRDLSQDTNNGGHRYENGYSNNKTNNGGHRYENGHINNKPNGHNNQPGPPPTPPKPEIDEDGFQTVSRNNKWKAQGI